MNDTSNVRYYQVKPVDRPNVYGLILKATGGELDVYAGESELRDIGASLNQGVLSRNYFIRLF